MNQTKRMDEAKFVRKINSVSILFRLDHAKRDTYDLKLLYIGGDRRKLERNNNIYYKKRSVQIQTADVWHKLRARNFPKDYGKNFSRM